MQVNGYLCRISNTPEMRQTTGGTQVANFNVANEEGWGESKKTSFFDCVAWGKTANTICNFFNKGDSLIIEGKWDDKSYTDKNTGKRVKHMQYTVSKVIFLPKQKDSQTDNYNPASIGTPDGGNQELGFEEIASSSEDLPF